MQAIKKGQQAGNLGKYCTPVTFLTKSRRHIFIFDVGG